MTSDAAGAAGTLLRVDIGEMQLAADPDTTLVTYALGSCVAVVLHDPRRRIGGMLHYSLPLSGVGGDRARDQPGRFADTGIPLLFERMYALGSSKRDIVVKVVGAGQPLDDPGTFNIGRRNYVILRKIFWKNEVMIAAEDVFGRKSRTVRLHVGTGRVTVRSGSEELVL